MIRCAALFLLLTTTCAAVAQVTTPQAHLGRPVGGDFTLADWTEVSSYFVKLDAESSRVVTKKVGTTAEGRDFLISTITSEANLANLDSIKHHARTLADRLSRDSVRDETGCRDQHAGFLRRRERQAGRAKNIRIR